MNTAATLAFVTVMVLGMGGLTGLVWRDRRTTPAPADDPLDADIRVSKCTEVCTFAAIWPPPATVYDAVVLELGDPAHIDFTAPTPAW